MKLKFKHQPFQADAAAAICDIFTGQPKIERQIYRKDVGIIRPAQMTFLGSAEGQASVSLDLSETGFSNAPFQISEGQMLENVRRIQLRNGIKPDDTLVPVIAKVEEKVGKAKKTTTYTMKYNFDIEMETGTGKTYVYIKTMYELNARYGWTKFIVVVPSVAIREGVFKSFQVTEEHFMEEYKKKIRFFLYKSSNLTDIDNFASDSGINVMIINAQAFNARGKDARRIYMQLDSFRSRRPIDILSRTNPIVIVDEPQSVEGKRTQERLGEFNALFTLRYSATHKQKHNVTYRLDAQEAYNTKLVKKIAVKGISVTGSTGTDGYLYLHQIVTSVNKAPIGMLEYEVRSGGGIRKITRQVNVGYNLYDNSGDMEQYDGFVVSDINAYTNTLAFTNGVTLHAGDVVGQVSEEQIRRIQIRETIMSHLDTERELYAQGIKVLSLFFIDEVSKYRVYGEQEGLGEYAKIFEEEYKNALIQQAEFGKDAYYAYLDGISASDTHDGYFSMDKQKRIINSETKGKSTQSDDSDAYDLIMRDKERLLSLDEPVRFIFSHSALREGWDNPNVFQICTLKKLSSSDIRARQELGRGLRLCVNQNGERMDASVLGANVQDINKLTVITDYEYTSYVKALQEGLAEAVTDRPRTVNTALFEGRKIEDARGNAVTISGELAQVIFEELIHANYVKGGKLTDQYYEDKRTGNLNIGDDCKEYASGIVRVLDSVYNPKAFEIENGFDDRVTPIINNDNFAKKEFKELWARINKKSAYTVNFDENELIRHSIQALNLHLKVTPISFRVVKGELKSIKSKMDLETGSAFTVDQADVKSHSIQANEAVTYDLLGKIALKTGLTRASVAKILMGIEPLVFKQFAQSPEEFIDKASELIEEQKATVVIEHITYHMTSATYEENIFTDHKLKGKLGVNAITTDKRHIFSHLIYDSEVEKRMGEQLETSGDVCVYAKLPKGFHINTPVGKYNPDWAIAFMEGAVKHVYFVAETKGSMSTMQLKKVEELKIECAKKHFEKISNATVKYDVVDGFEGLMALVR